MLFSKRTEDLGRVQSMFVVQSMLMKKVHPGSDVRLWQLHCSWLFDIVMKGEEDLSMSQLGSAAVHKFGSVLLS